MKTQIFIALLTLPLACLHANESTINKINAPYILADLGGVHFRTSKKVMAWRMGLYNTICYITSGNSTSALQNQLFTFLNTIEVERPNNIIPCDNSGKPLPPIMHAWIAGTIDTAHARALIQYNLYQHCSIFKNKTERTLIANICKTIFTPKLFANSMKFLPKRWELIASLKKMGCKVIILSNWDAESFEYIRKQYPELEATADAIVISGSVNLVKPDPEIFEYVLENYNLQPEQCVLIDDQEENLHAAEKLGISTINGSFTRSISAVRSDFQKWFTTYNLQAAKEHESEPSPADIYSQLTEGCKYAFNITHELLSYILT